MTTAFKGIAAAVAILAATATSAFAADTEHKFEKAAAYYGQCSGATEADFENIREQVKAFTDVEIMAETMNDPEKLFALMNVVNDPHTIHVMANCATEPVMWETWMRGGTDPNKWAGAMAKMMNPVGMMKWMMAPMNPNIWAQAMAHAYPAKYDKSSVAVANPTFYTPMTNMFSAEWYQPRLSWMANAESYAPLTNMFMPQQQ